MSSRRRGAIDGELNSSDDDEKTDDDEETNDDEKTKYDKEERRKSNLFVTTVKRKIHYQIYPLSDI